LKKRGDMGTNIEGAMPNAPGLKSRSGNVEVLGGLAFGDALGSQLLVLLKEIGAFEAIPARLAARVDLWPVLDYGSHRDLLGSSLAC
jgi:hypothetical protein